MLPLSLSLLTPVIMADEPYQQQPTSPHHYGVDYTDNRTHDDNGNGKCSSSAMAQTLITVIIS